MTLRTVLAPRDRRPVPVDAPPSAFVMVTDYRHIISNVAVYRGWRRDDTVVYFVRSDQTRNLAFGTSPTGYLHECDARADALRVGHLARAGVVDYPYWVPDLWPLPVAAVAWLYRDASRPPRSRPRRAAAWQVIGHDATYRWVMCDLDAAAVAYGTHGFNVDCCGYDTHNDAIDAAEEHDYCVAHVIDMHAQGYAPTPPTKVDTMSDKSKVSQ